MTNKSLLTGVPISTNEEWDKFMDGLKGNTTSRPCLEVVGACQKCGSPVYGQKVLRDSEQPIIKRSCSCFDKLEFQSTISVK